MGRYVLKISAALGTLLVLLSCARRFALVLALVLSGCPAFLIPTQVFSENVNTKPGRRITLLNHHHNSKKSSVSFRDDTYDASIGPRHDPDLLYGALNFNGDRDWFKVAFGSHDRSRIRDLGTMDWSDDIALPVLPILPCRTNQSCGGIQIPPPASGKKIQDEDVNPHVAKAIVGHMYLVHTSDKERDLHKLSEFDVALDFYTLVRVEELKANESCTITWKRIPSPKNAHSVANGLKRMYVLDCGRLIAKDQSRWTLGVNAGQPRELSNNCYLFQHVRGTLLWETGVPDSVIEQKDGVTSPNGAVVWFRDKTLKSQLESLGVKPDDITYVAMSHTHGDHIGNARAFAKSKILMQKLEHEFAMSTTPKPLGDDQNVEMLSGDRDVFGDSSVTIISTPGHTPGHQSLLVKLPKTGALILTGDLVHFQYMWDNKIVPPLNFNKEQSLASIERVVQLIATHKAQLWIGHDKDVTARINRAPKFYE